MIGRTLAEQEYLDAWVDLANMPSPWERSAAQEAEAEAARQRLDTATQAHYEEGTRTIPRSDAGHRRGCLTHLPLKHD